jgi:hypothetical protein
LLSGLGASLVERALLDAFCRATGRTFAQSVHENTLGVVLSDVYPELGDAAGATPASFLPRAPRRTIIARHTVGLADPLTDADISPAERLDDGLPQSLEACVRAYGLTHFKIKLSGDLARDIARLRQIAVVLRPAEGPAGGYHFTLDGNEQYHTLDAFRDAWRSFAAEPSLRTFMPHLLFVEQPLHRDATLGEAASRALAAWHDRPPIIVDESDGEPESLPRALAAGYAGASYKNCKGVFRGLASACLLAYRRSFNPGRHYVLSGEDLANVGPVALLQDLAAMATLGVEHVERNGHHYFAGLSMYPAGVQAQVLAAHGELYRRHPAGFPTLAIYEGKIDVGSVVDAPFGVGFLLDPTQFTPLDAWQYESLGIEE